MAHVEIWKPIPGYLNYKVSNLGRVKSIDRLSYSGSRIKGKILTPIRTRAGYLKVNLVENGMRKEGKIHRLVMAAFIGECPDGLVVNHIDENKTNNHLDNLEYVTSAQNANHGTRNNRLSKILTGRKCSKESRKRISESRKKAVLCIETNEIFASAQDAALPLGIRKCGIAAVCCGIQKTAGGYHWRYV